MPRIHPSKLNSQNEQTLNETKQKKSTENDNNNDEASENDENVNVSNNITSSNKKMAVDEKEENRDDQTKNGKNSQERGSKSKNVKTANNGTKSNIKMDDGLHSRRVLTPKKTPRIARVTKGKSIELTIKNQKVFGWIKDQKDEKILIRWQYADNNNIHFEEQWFNKNDKRLHIFDRRFDVEPPINQ